MSPIGPHPPTPSAAAAGEGERIGQPLLVQMHGDPGSGKSTLAKAIGVALPAIVIDKDAIKSPMMNGGIAAQLAGGVAHDILRELAADFIEAGHSVVMDSPCGWPIIEERGRALAARVGVPWFMIELTCPFDVIDARLASRTARLSNPTTRQDWEARPGTYRPSCERLVLDGTRPIEDLVQEALVYLTKSPHPPTPSPAAASEGERHSALGSRESGVAV